jgi:hypothetical protein
VAAAAASTASESAAATWNIALQPRYSSMYAPAIIPRVMPMATVALRMPWAVATLSRGKTSVTIAMPSGKRESPSPWMALTAIR